MSGARHEPAAPRISKTVDLPFWILIALMTGLAWIALLVWSASPYDRYLDHGDWTRLGYAGEICLAFGSGGLMSKMLYMLAWLVMSAAMMLPSTAPLVNLFAKLVRRRADRQQLFCLLLLGYLLIWMLFGLLAEAAGLMLGIIVRSLPWLAFNGWVIAAAMLLLAGLFQFTRLKERCLKACQNPFTFIAMRWHGDNAGLESFAIGIAHGLFCVACCWALMLLMAGIGAGSLVWMLVLAAIMAIEKNRAGQWLSRPLGVGLLAGSLGLTGFHLAA